MATRSFIKRILSLGRSGEEAEAAPASEGLLGEGAMAASGSGEAALRPSITEILFRRRSQPEAGEAETGTKTETGEQELVPDRAGERRVSRKEETAQKISEGFDNLSGLLKSISEKLETGNARGRALHESIEGLPEVLKSIPETNQAQIEFLGTISKQLDLQTTRAGELVNHLKTLPEILRSLPDTQERLVKQLTGLGEKLERDTENQLAYMRGAQKAQQASLVAFQNTQNKSLNLFHKAQQQSLAVFKHAQAEQAGQIRELIEMSQRSMMRVLLACAGIVGAAIVGAAALYFLR